MKKNPYKGKFIVLEGLDGCGTSTQSRLLKNFLIKKRYKVILTREPTRYSIYWKKIKKILMNKGKVPAEKLQEFFIKDREIHLKKEVIPALSKKDFVISDRYFFSTFAYGLAENVDLEWLIKLNSKFLFPDITFFLKVRPSICIKRIKKRKEKETLFENKKKLEKIYKCYQIIINRFPLIKIINGEKPIKEVFNDIKKEIEKNLLKSKC